MRKDTLKFCKGTSIIASASVVGAHEHEGPIGVVFDFHDSTDRFGKKTWEKAESEMQRIALNVALSKSKLASSDMDAIFAGDLLNQCAASSYGLVDFDVPYYGIYGACSTAAEGMMLGAMSVSAGYFSKCVAVTWN